MFLTVLGSALVVGTGLLAAASYSEGALIAARTAAQGIGWLLILAGALGVSLLGRATVAKAGAAAVAFFSGSAVLYAAYFHWDEIPATPVRQALAAAADWPAEPKLIEPQPPAPVLVSSAVGAKPLVSAIAAPPIVADACASLDALESMQCRRCGEKTGLARIFCHESARLEYCEGRPADEVTCPSAIPYSPPG